MKAVPIKKAIDAVVTIAPPMGPVQPYPTEAEVRSYHDIMGGFGKVRDHLSVLEPTYEDLRVLRAMIAAELSRQVGPRLEIVKILIKKHESLYSTIRLDAMMAELPALAVFLDKDTPPRAVPKTGAALHATINNALFGVHNGTTED